MKSATVWNNQQFAYEWRHWASEGINPLSACYLRECINPINGEVTYFVSLDDYIKGPEFDYAPSNKSYKTKEQALAAVGRALDQFNISNKIANRSFN